jgi:drug/metabolite transporter (DMT)-like permease
MSASRPRTPTLSKMLERWSCTSLIVASIPLFTSLLAVVFLGEHLGHRGWCGLVAGFCGVALITLGEEEGGFGVNRALFLLLSAASVSVYFALQKPYLEKYGALPFTTTS